MEVPKMARFNFNDVDKYDTNSHKKNKWLTLSNDGDSALVQFPFDSLDAIFCEDIHKIRAISQAGTPYDMKVACLRQNYNDELAVCPFCSSGIDRTQEFYVPVIDYNTGEPMLWSKTKTFIQKTLAYTIQNTPNFSKMVFKIVRCGAKGDKKTTYNLYPQMQLPAKDFSNVKPIDPVGAVIREKTYDEMMEYLKTGEFPKPQQEQPIQQAQQVAPQPQAQATQQPRANFEVPNTQVW